ncbi:PEP-CTERM sorting domain-containing protein [bacterium]|nr:PEP-CTERM sorting domain-containing protein [Akkermansiaceae bacterium]MDB4588172.1 PEP-CTERM sorting domain-containing protein [bacterium]MDB4259972.1 PEP-CTERM sorting domain-containing protein [Akkermansiaceae bacterium]MDB4274797.1 PEP-CTERM sorting domain-containing protein [Akkermansiaceae bacterium]MDB4332862.1 PEP-CTERM sorting domain-containing protein [Akkermansiaceae bacterium]
MTAEGIFVVVALALATLYGPAGVDDVDLYVGMLLEGDLPDSIMGEVGMAILADQFSRLQEGDRFYFENNADGVNDDLQEVASWNEVDFETTYDFIDNETLSEIIALNTGATGLQDNVFLAQPIPEPSTGLLALLGGLMIIRRRR